MASCVFNGDLSFKSGRNETEIFAAVVEPELLSYSFDGICVTDVIVSKSFVLSSTGM